MILVVDDDKTIRLSLKLILERNDYEVTLAEEPKAALQIIRNTPAVELVLMDMNYSRSTNGEEGLTLLKQVKVFKPQLPVILMTAWGSIDLAVQGMRAGAFDFITKPWDNGVLLERIETAVKLKNPQTPTKVQPKTEGNRIIGTSLASILATIARVAPTNAPVLITGESGTGKELIAEAIHRQSRRANGPFVKVNLGGISTSLFESEMFGHKMGSFTDAKADRVGRFEMAKGGTIFLDEIGELSLASQVKLLRVLQDQTYEVLGDSQTRRTDVRVVCATNADLRAMVSEHTFREDLFYRINLINLHLPPLRERPEDIPLLVEHFLRQACADNNMPPVTASDEAIAYLQTLPFPGNIRELKNMVERALLMNEGRELTATSFAPLSQEPIPLSASPTSPSPSLSSLERTAIATCIAKHGGNLSLVAKELGISRGALYRKIEKHGL
jgi:two-component system NtrC family response regulator